MMRGVSKNILFFLGGSILKSKGKKRKRYCELDTLAMVMIYEHLKSIV